MMTLSDLTSMNVMSFGLTGSTGSVYVKSIHEELITKHYTINSNSFTATPSSYLCSIHYVLSSTGVGSSMSQCEWV